MSRYYLWCEAQFAGYVAADLPDAVRHALDVAALRRAAVVISDEGSDPDRDDLVHTYRKGPRAATVDFNGAVEFSPGYWGAR